jgi:predicted nucleotidyltransferase
MALEVQTTLLEDPELYEMVRRIADVYHPLRIYLFGSKARGDAGPDSDCDLLVVVADDAPPELRKSKLACEKLWGGRRRRTCWYAPTVGFIRGLG